MTPSYCSMRCSRYAICMFAYRSCASRTSDRFPKSVSASSKNKIALLPTAAVKIRSRFFSVSPMYLLTTAERSTRNRSRPSSSAITPAASVFPVPDAPENSARSELPPAWRARDHSPNTRSRFRIAPASSCSRRNVGRGQDEIRPAVRRLDRARERTERLVGLDARVPRQRREVDRVVAARRDGGALDLVRAEGEQAGDRPDVVVDDGCGPERRGATGARGSLRRAA